MHLKDIENGGSVKSFALKRVIRIYPMYWLSLLATVLIIAPEFRDKPALVYELDPHTLHGWITIIKNVILFPLTGEQMPVRVAWTLIYEMFFYLVFAGCIIVGWKKARVIYLAWVLLVLIYSRDVIERTPITETMFGSLIMEFLFGCLAGYLFLKMQKKISVQLFTAGLIAIAAIFVVYLTYREFNRYAILSTILMGSASALIMLFAAQRDRERAKPANKALMLIGNASYSIYITHSIYAGFICKGLAYLFDVQAWNGIFINLLILFVFIITLAMGIAIHLYIENPIMNFLRIRLNVGKRKLATA